MVADSFNRARRSLPLLLLRRWCCCQVEGPLGRCSSVGGELITTHSVLTQIGFRCQTFSVNLMKRFLNYLVEVFFARAASALLYFRNGKVPKVRLFPWFFVSAEY